MPENSQPKLKVFQTTQKNFAMMGISRKLATQAYPLNVRILMGFLILYSLAIFNLIYTIYYAKTFAEYTQSVYVFSLGALIILALFIVILKVNKLFELIDNCNSIVNMSTYRN